MRLRYRRQAIVKLGVVVITLIIVIPLIVHHFDHPANEEDPAVIKKKLRVSPSLFCHTCEYVTLPLSLYVALLVYNSFISDKFRPYNSSIFNIHVELLFSMYDQLMNICLMSLCA